MRKLVDALNRNAGALTAAATLVLIIVGALQWRAVKDANELSRNALVSVQRAFVAHKSIDVEARAVTGVSLPEWHLELVW